MFIKPLMSLCPVQLDMIIRVQAADGIIEFWQNWTSYPLNMKERYIQKSKIRQSINTYNMYTLCECS